MDKLGKSSSGTITARLQEEHSQHLTADQVIEKFLVKSGLDQSYVKCLLDPSEPRSTQKKGLIDCLRAALNPGYELLAAATSSRQNASGSELSDMSEESDSTLHNDI